MRITSNARRYARICRGHGTTGRSCSTVRSLPELFLEIDLSQRRLLTSTSAMAGCIRCAALRISAGPAPHVIGNLSCIAYTEADGRIFLLEFVSGSWRSIEVLANVHGAPAAAGDPAAVGVCNEQIIVYRGADAHVYALSRKITEPSGLWSRTQVGGNAIGDPFVTVFGKDLHVVYWDSSDHQAHVVRT